MKKTPTEIHFPFIPCKLLSQVAPYGQRASVHQALEDMMRSQEPYTHVDEVLHSSLIRELRDLGYRVFVDENYDEDGKVTCIEDPSRCIDPKRDPRGLKIRPKKS
jgi:hypothetical protein